MTEPRDPLDAAPTATIDEQIYTHADLVAKLGDFETYLVSEGLTSSATFSYTDGAGRFLRWLVGEYRPRNASTSIIEPVPRRQVWTAVDLRDDLTRYGDELRAARMKRLAIQAYASRADTFIRWLEGRYRSRGPHGPRATTDEDDSWLDEVWVQAKLIGWLEREGWTVVRQARGREHGTDVDAVRGRERLAVEVKGHPRRLHTFGARKGQQRKWHAGAQARTYFGNALHSAISMLHADPERQVAIALPDVAVYRGLVDRSRDPLRRLGIRIWFVDRDGEVTHG